MGKYIVKHIERNHKTGEESAITSAVYDTKLDDIYGAEKSLKWAINTAEFMGGFVEFLEGKESTIIHQCLRRASN